MIIDSMTRFKLTAWQRLRSQSVNGVEIVVLSPCCHPLPLSHPHHYCLNHHPILMSQTHFRYTFAAEHAWLVDIASYPHRCQNPFLLLPRLAVSSCAILPPEASTWRSGHSCKSHSTILAYHIDHILGQICSLRIAILAM